MQICLKPFQRSTILQDRQTVLAVRGILTLPFIATFLFIVFTDLNKFPHLFNYPVSITAENAPRLRTNATRMIGYLKLVSVVVFGLIVLQTIRNANGQTSGLGTWFLPSTLGLFLISMTYFIVKSVRAKKSNENMQ